MSSARFFLVACVALAVAVGSSAAADQHLSRERRQAAAAVAADTTVPAGTTLAGMTVSAGNSTIYSTTPAPALCGRKPCKPTKVPECSRAKLHVITKGCCGATPAPLFSADQLLSCSKKRDRKFNDWANAFTLPLLQQGSRSRIAKNQAIVLTDKKTLKFLCHYGELINCLFNSTGMVDVNGTVNFTATAEIMVKSQTDQSYKVALANYTGVLKGLVTMINRNLTFVSCPATKRGGSAKNTTILPLLIVQLAQNLMTESCPGPLAGTKRNKCDVLRSWFNYCSGLLTDFVFTDAVAHPAASNVTSFMRYYLAAAGNKIV